MIQQIVYLEFFKAKRFDHYHNLVLKLNDLRTYVAHYPIGFGFEDGISFYKIEAKYKNPFPSSISESFIGEMKIIELTIKTQREIELQIIIASEYGLNQIKKLER